MNRSKYRSLQQYIVNDISRILDDRGQSCVVYEIDICSGIPYIIIHGIDISTEIMW